MNEKTSINSIYPNLWAPTAGQDLTVMQQYVYQKKFRNVYEIKKPRAPLIGLEQNFIDTTVNE